MTVREESLLGRLVDTLPRLRTKMQVLGLLILVVGFVVSQSIPPERVRGTLAAGSVGVFILIFGQVFQSLQHIPARQRHKLILGLAALFVVLVLAALAVAAYLFVRDSPRGSVHGTVAASRSASQP